MNFRIETERLILRDVRMSDLPVLLAQAAEPEARRNILAYQGDEHYNRLTLINAIGAAKVSPRENYTLSVVLKNDRSLIGNCTIADVKAKSIETVIGWHYGHAFRKRGYATEAARALLYIGFALNDVAEIYADCFIGNLASRRVMEKIGMTMRRNLGLFNLIRGWSYGEHKPTVRYIIAREEWERIKN